MRGVIGDCWCAEQKDKQKKSQKTLEYIDIFICSPLPPRPSHDGVGSHGSRRIHYYLPLDPDRTEVEGV